MSRTIDERVVTLQFDNAEFEKNVKTSMSSLDKLEKSLKFKDADEGFKRVNDAAEKTNFNPLIKAQVTVTEGFSTMERVAINVLSSIAIRAEQAGERLVRSLSTDNIRDGWNKYNDKIASVQTLVNSTGKSLDEINDSLDKLMWFSDETSYSFNDMTKSLAQLTSSGGKVENLMPMIMGIANATAFAGKSTQEFSRAIYNLNQSYGAGSLKYMDWKSLELAGVATKDLKQSFIDTAIELGKLNEYGQTSKGTLVELGNFGETLKEGWADTSVMEATFGKFYQYTEMAYQMINEGVAENASDAYEQLSRLYDDIYIKAARSAQEAKTFTEAIEATKDAVSTKWMKSFDLVFGNYDQSKDLFTRIANSFWDIFASGGDIRNDILSSAFDDDYTKLKGLFQKAGADFNGFNQDFQKFLVDSGYDVNSLIKDYGTLSNAIAHNADIMDLESERYYNLGERLKSYIGITKLNLVEYTSSVKDTEKITEHLQTLFDNVWLGTYGNGEERVRKLTAANIDYATTQELINKLASEGHRAGYKLLAEDIEHLTDAELKNMGITREQAYVISDALKDVSGQAVEAQDELKDLLKTMGKKASGRVYLADSLVNVLETIVALQEKVREAWSNVFSDVDFGSVIANAMERVYNFTEGVKTAITESETLVKVFEIVFKVLRLVGKGFSIIYEAVRQLVSGGLKILSGLFKDISIDTENFGKAAEEAFDYALKWLQENEPIVQLLESASGSIVKAFENVQKWISKFVTMEDVTNTLNGVRKSLEGFIGNDFGLTSLTNAYNAFVESVTSGSTDPFKVVSDNIGTFFANVVTSFSEFKTNIKDRFTAAFSSLQWTDEEIQNFTDTLKKLTEVLTGVGAGYVFLSMFTKLAGALETLAAPFRTLSDLIGAGKKTLDSVTGYINAQKNNILIQNIVKIAIAVGILAASMYALATVGKTGDLWTAIGATGALLGIIAGFALVIALIGKINSGDGKKAQINMKELALVIISLGGSVLLIAAAMKALDGVEHIWRNLFVVALSMAALVTALRFANKNKMIISDIFNMIGIAIAILILARAVSKLDQLKLKNPWAVIIELLGIIGAMVAISWAVKGVSKKSAFVLVAFTSSLLGFVKVIEAFAAMDSKDYLKGLLKIIPIIGAMIGITVALKAIPEKSIEGAAIYLIATAASVLLVGKAIENLGKIKIGSLLKGGIAAVTLFGVIGLIGAGIAHLAFVEGATIRAAVGTSVLIIALSGSLYLMAGAILIFKNIDPAGLWTSVGTIASLLGAIGAVMYYIGQGGLFAEGSQAYAAVAALGKIAIIIGVLAVSLAVLSFLPTEKLIIAAASMAGVIAALALLTFVMQKYKVSDMLVAFGTVVLILGAVGGILFALTSITQDTNKAVAIAESLTKILIALGEMFVMSAVANMLVSATGTFIGIIPALKTIGVVIGVMAGVIALIESLFPQATDYILGLLDKVGAIVTKVGEIIGGFVGTAIGSIGTGFTAELVKVGENLSSFATSVENFTRLTVPETFESTLASMVSMFTSLGPQYGNIVKLASLSEDSKGLVDFLTDYGASLVVLSNSMDGVNVDNLNAAANVGTMFAALNDSLGPNGFMSFLSGKQTLTSFSSNLENFGKGIVAFSDTLSNYKSQYVQDALPSIEHLIAIEGTLQNRWSLLGWLTGGDNGNKSLSDFGKRAKDFGAGLAAMSDELTEFNPDSVDAAVSAGEALTALEKGLTDSWNLVGWLGLSDEGNLSLGDFGNRIQEFAAGLVNGLNAFATLGTAVEETAPSEDFVGPMNKTALNFEKVTENVDWIVAIGEKFAGLENSLGESASFIGSTSKLKSFGDGLAAFSTGFKTFTENIPDNLPDETTVSSMIDLIDKFVQFTGTDGIGTESGNILTNIGKGIGSMAEGIKSGFDSLFSFDNASVMGGEGDSEGQSWIQSISDRITNIFSNEETTEQIETGATEAGEAYLSSLQGVFTKSDALKKMMESASDTAAGICEKFKVNDHEGHKMSYEGVYFNIGKNYIKGIIEGMESMTGELYKLATEIAETTSSIVSGSWQEHSPSKVAYRMGAFFVEGLANGISDLSDEAISNAGSMAESVRNAVVDAMIISDQMVENAMSPVISPVLDTANVLSGANTINGLLASGASYNAALSVQDARTARSLANIQNGGKGALITMNNTFEINGISSISDPQLVNEMADKLYKRINVLLGSAI